MILDAQLQFSAAQALTATAASTNIVDLSSDRDIGIGTGMAVVFTLGTIAKGSSGDETYSAAIQTDSSSGFGSAVTLGTVTITRLDAAGTKYVFLIPPDKTPKEFLRVNYTLGGSSPSVTVTAELQPQSMIQNDNYFPRGYTVLG